MTTAVAAYKSVSGLNTYSNSYAMDTQGSSLTRARSMTTIANNTDLSQDLQLGNRWGFDYFTKNTSANVSAFFEYQSFVIEHQNGDGTLWLGTTTSGSRTAFSTANAAAGKFTAPTANVFGQTLNYRMDGAVARGSLFFTTSGGIMKIDDELDIPTLAGAPRPLDLNAVTTGSGGGWLSGNSNVAYRLTWVRTDDNAQTTLSAPSQQAFVQNNNQVSCAITSAAGTATVTTSPNHTYANGQSVTISGSTIANYNGTYVIAGVTASTFTYAVAGSPASPATGTIIASLNLNTAVSFTVPLDVIAGDSWQLWRTKQVTASNPPIAPGDNEFLVSQAVYAGSPGAVFTYTDVSADSVLVTELYTNADQQGIQNANTRPPYACALDVYYQYTFYGNTALPYTLSLAMLGTSGIVNGNTITLKNTVAGTSRNYAFGAAENPTTQTFLLQTGLATPALNIQATMQSFCRIVNQDPSGQWYAEYASTFTSNPGIVTIWARAQLNGGFSVTCTNATVGADFSPAIPTAGATLLGTSDTRSNRLYYSKADQPDAVPLANFIDVGRIDMPIERVLALRDGLYVLKQDGVFWVYGLAPPFTLIQIDATAQILAPASAVKLNNQVYGLFNLGVCVVTSAGTQVVSLEVNPDITRHLTLSNLRTVAFGVAFEAQRYYMLWLPNASGDTVAPHSFIYHVFRQQWVFWTKPAAAGIVLSSNRTMYISSGVEQAVLQQRNSGTAADYADETVAMTITGVATTSILVNKLATTVSQLTVTWTSIFTPTAGLLIAQGGTTSKAISVTQVPSTTTYVIVLDQSLTWTNGAATATMPIYSQIEFPPDVCDEATKTKCFRKVVLQTEQATASQVTIYTSTNEAPNTYSYNIYRPLSQGWGGNPWDSTPWGDQPNPASSLPFTIDVPVPNNTGEEITVGWKHNVAGEQYFLVLVAMWYESIAEYESQD